MNEMKIGKGKVYTFEKWIMIPPEKRRIKKYIKLLTRFWSWRRAVTNMRRLVMRRREIIIVFVLYITETETVCFSNFSISQICLTFPGRDHISKCSMLVSVSVSVLIIDLSDCGSSFRGTEAPSSSELETWSNTIRRVETEQNIIFGAIGIYHLLIRK